MNRENDIMNMVSHPEHYNTGEVEVIDIIEGLIKDIDDPTVGFNVGQCLKYILRCPYKENMYRDLKKTEWYLQRAIKILEDNCTFESEDILENEIEDILENEIEDIQTTFNDDITNIGFELGLELEEEDNDE